MVSLFLAQAAKAAQTVQSVPPAKPETTMFQSIYQRFFMDGQILNLSIKLIGALIVLLAGWLFAYLAARLVRKGLEKIGFGGKVSKCIPDSSNQAGSSIETWISRIVFYVILLIAFLAFLNVFELSVAAEPIKQLLNKITGYGANLIGAAILLLVAWILATLIRFIAAKVMETIRLDERLSEHLDAEEKEKYKISKSVADVFYWLVFLCFLPGILGVLEIKGIMDPFKAMLDKVFIYLPNLLSGIIIFIIGFFTAKIVRKIVTLLLVSIGSDDLSRKTGLSRIFGEKGFSQAIGILVYALIVLPTLAIALNAMHIEALSKPLSNMIDILLKAFSGLFGAVLLLFAAHIIGHILGKLTTQLLESFGFNKIFVSLHVFNSEKEIKEEKSPAVTAGKLVYILIIIFAAVAIADMLGFSTLGTVIAAFIPIAGRILLGFIVFLIGFYFAGFAAETAKGKGKCAGVISLIIRFAILLFAGAMALNCMGIADQIVQIAFAAIVGAVAIALAIAFGVGGRDIAAQQLQEWKNSIQNNEEKK